MHARISLAGCLVLSGGLSLAATIHVPADQPTIQAGIDAAGSGDLVQVAAGTYKEKIHFKGKNIEVRGAGADLSVVNPASLSYGRARVVTFSNEGPSAVLSGFTLTGGRNGKKDVDYETFNLSGRGAGVRFTDSSATIADCNITGNRITSGSWGGGGIYCLGSNPVISNCTISDNFSTGSVGGGGILCDQSNPTVTDCTFSDNDSRSGWTGGNGGGINCWNESAPVISGCTFIRNTSNYGGAIDCSNNAAATIARCILVDNEAEWAGGGIYASASAEITGSVISNNSVRDSYRVGWGGGVAFSALGVSSLTNCILAGNEARLGGGVYAGYASPAITNTVIANNFASEWGGGVYCGSGSYSSITNCTISDNLAPNGGGLGCVSGSPKVSNSILWGNGEPNVGITLDANPVFAYCNVAGGISGESNIDADPRFVSWRGFDYVLRPGSPCIDSGNWGDDSVDWSDVHDAYGRHNSASPDMGAYGGPGAMGWLE